MWKHDRVLMSQHPCTQEVEVGILPQDEPGLQNKALSQKSKTWKGGRNVGKQKGKEKGREKLKKCGKRSKQTYNDICLCTYVYAYVR